MRVSALALRTLGFAALCALAAIGLAAPEALLVQVKGPRVAREDPNIGVLSYLWEELDLEGRVTPIAWSMSDPIFRAAVDDGLIKNPAIYPSLGDARSIAKKLKIENVVVVEAWKQDDVLMAKCLIYRGDKIVWQDPDPSDPLIESQRKSLEAMKKNAKAVGAQIPDVAPFPSDVRVIDLQIGDTGLNVENALRSLARTWGALMAEGPFQGYPAHKRTVTPPPDQGQQPVVADPPPLVKADNKELMQQVMKLLAAGGADQAVSLLRDAVDSFPSDVERRRALISALMQANRPKEAAVEARRAAELMPEEGDFRSLAARAWLQADNPDEANTDLNEAVARDPNSPETRLLLAEVNLTKLEPELAIPHLDAVIAGSPNADGFYRRAFARSMAGQQPEMAADLAAAARVGLDDSTHSSRFGFAARVTDQWLDATASAVRSLFQRSRVRPDEPEVHTDRAALIRKAECLAEFFDTVQTPPTYKTSSDKRVLALKLLAQCLADLSAYLSDKDEDAMSDATINLGESIKNAKAAKELFRQETSK